MKKIDELYRWTKVIVVLLIAVACLMYAYSSRFEVVNNILIIDKWTKTVHRAEFKK